MNATLAQQALGNMPPAALTDILWQAFSRNLNSGACTVIEMPIHLKTVIGSKGVDAMAARFRSLIQAPVIVSEDSNRGLVIIAPARNVLGHDELIPQAKTMQAKVSKTEKVARPPNAFILYRKHHHPLIKAAHPDFHNNQISVILGTQWKLEMQAVKNQYVKLAQQLKAKHLREHPDYQYQPRKPSEKKRRMSRRKASALATKGHTATKPSTESRDVETAASPTTPLELPRTVTGNVVLDFGDESMDDAMLAAALQDYNDALPQPANQLNSIITESTPPVLYDEPTEATQNDDNFFNSVFDFDSFPSTNAELEKEMDDFFADQDYMTTFDTMSPNSQKAAFDALNDFNFDAEINRQESI